MEEELNKLKEEKKILEAKILSFYAKNKDADDYDIGPILMKEYKEFFNIQGDFNGTMGNRS